MCSILIKGKVLPTVRKTLAINFHADLADFKLFALIGTFEQRSNSILKSNIFMYPWGLAKNDQLRMLGKFKFSRHPIGCTHLADRAHRKSGYD
jgi:hypothetical protein